MAVPRPKRLPKSQDLKDTCLNMAYHAVSSVRTGLSERFDPVIPDRSCIPTGPPGASSVLRLPSDTAAQIQFRIGYALVLNNHPVKRRCPRASRQRSSGEIFFVGRIQFLRIAAVHGMNKSSLSEAGFLPR